MSIPKTLRFKFPSTLFAEVMNLVEAGKADLYEGIFVSYENELCQVMLLGKLSFFDYRLLDVDSIQDLDASMVALSNEGWEPYSNTVLYGGKYLQWMSRLKWAESIMKNALISNQFKMVEDVRPMQLVERGELFSSWKNPFTVNLGGSHE